jgi:hypothetical protein
MNARHVLIAALLALTGASLGFAQGGFVPAGSIVIDCDEVCRIEMPGFGLVEVAEPQETISLGGLPGGTHDLRIESGPDSWDLTVTVCGTATAVRVGGGEATIEPPLCAPFGFLAITLPSGARAEVAQRTLRASTTAALYVGVYDVVFTRADGERETATVVVSEGATTEVGFAPSDATVTFVGVPLDAIIRFSRAGSFEGPGPHVLAPGLYVVEIDAPGFAKTSFTLHLEAGAQLQHGVQLELLPPGYARLLVSPAIARIEIAGETHGSGDTIPLAPGDYLATITAPGYETATVPVAVISEATSTVEVRLNAILGRLVLSSVPRNAEVRIAGHTYSAGDVIPLAPGDYVATVTAPGYETVTVPVTIISGATSTVPVRLIEARGRLVLRVEPRNAEVRIAGNTYAAGETAQLRPNTYTVVVSAPGFEPFEGSVRIGPAADTVLEVSLAQQIALEGRLLFSAGALRGTDTDFYTVNEDGTDVRLLLDTPGWIQAAYWSRDRSRILYTDNLGAQDRDHRLATTGPDGTVISDERLVRIIGPSCCHGGSYVLGWHPDEDSFLYKKEESSCTGNLLWRRFLDGSEEVFLDPAVVSDGVVAFIAFSPDGNEVTWVSQDGCWSPSSAMYRAPMVNGQVDTRRIELVYRDGQVLWWLAYAGDGTLAFQNTDTVPYDYPKNLYLEDAGTITRITDFFTDDAWVDTFAWSPDGARIAYSETSNASSRSGSADIVIINRDGTGRVPVVTTPDVWERVWGW